MPVISLDSLLSLLYETSMRALSNNDRSRVGFALDAMLDYVGYWTDTDLKQINALFEQLEPERVVRAVNQTLLASTQFTRELLTARRMFILRCLSTSKITT